MWEAGQKAAAKSNWESARQHFKRIVDGFPQSQHGPEARLALGDSYFKEGGTGNYILAISAYRDFLTLYPSHPKSDYAQFQVGEGYFLQKSGPDRDQTNTQKALERVPAAPRVVSRPPPTPSRRGRASTTAARAWPGPSTWRGTSTSARARPTAPPSRATRASSRTIPTTKSSTRSFSSMAQCLVFLARKAEAAPQLDRLLSEYPQSSRANEAKALQEQLAREGVAPVAVSRRSARGPARDPAGRAAPPSGLIDLKFHFTNTPKSS